MAARAAPKGKSHWPLFIVLRRSAIASMGRPAGIVGGTAIPVTCRRVDTGRVLAAALAVSLSTAPALPPSWVVSSTGTRISSLRSVDLPPFACLDDTGRYVYVRSARVRLSTGVREPLVLDAAVRWNGGEPASLRWRLEAQKPGTPELREPTNGGRTRWLFPVYSVEVASGDVVLLRPMYALNAGVSSDDMVLRVGGQRGRSTPLRARRVESDVRAVRSRALSAGLPYAAVLSRSKSGMTYGFWCGAERREAFVPRDVLNVSLLREPHETISWPARLFYVPGTKAGEGTGTLAVFDLRTGRHLRVEAPQDLSDRVMFVAADGSALFSPRWRNSANEPEVASPPSCLRYVPGTGVWEEYPELTIVSASHDGRRIAFTRGSSDRIMLARVPAGGVTKKKSANEVAPRSE